jgi:outer membrane immunogenic protein
LGATSGYYNQSGGIVGGTIGANYQSGLFVLGVEADFSWTDIDGSVTLPGLCTAGQGTVCFTNMRWLNTDRVRVGAAIGSWMPYITAGVAGADIKTGQVSCSTPVPGGIASCGTITQWAPTFGAGLEMMFAPNWSAKVEWIYTDFGNNHTAYTVFIPVTVSETRVNIVRAGLNYRFW